MTNTKKGDPILKQNASSKFIKIICAIVNTIKINLYNLNIALFSCYSIFQNVMSNNF